MPEKSIIFVKTLKNMDERIRNKVAGILPEGIDDSIINEAVSQDTKKRDAATLAKFKSYELRKAKELKERAEYAEANGLDLKPNQGMARLEKAAEHKRNAELIEAIEVQEAEDNQVRDAVLRQTAGSPQIARAILATQGTTRAEVQKLLASLNINMNLQLTKTDTANLLACLLTCNEQQLNSLSANPKVPIAIKIIIKRLKEDIKLGNIETIEKIWDRIFGKAAMSLELPQQATAAGIIPNTPISREAYIVIRDTLIQ